MGICTVFKEYVIISNYSDDITFDTINRYDSRDKNRKEKKVRYKIVKPKSVGVYVLDFGKTQKLFVPCHFPTNT